MKDEGCTRDPEVTRSPWQIAGFRFAEFRLTPGPFLVVGPPSFVSVPHGIDEPGEWYCRWVSLAGKLLLVFGSPCKITSLLFFGLVLYMY